MPQTLHRTPATSNPTEPQLRPDETRTGARAVADGDATTPDRAGADAGPRSTDERGGVAEDPQACLRLDEQLCFALYSATSAVVRTYRPLLREIGLTYPQYVVMMALWERPDTTPTRLAARLDLPAHGLSPVLDRLHLQGLLLKRPHPHDGRVTRVTLTPAGRELERAAARAQQQVACSTHLAAEVLARIRDDLHNLTAQLSTTAPRQPRG